MLEFSRFENERKDGAGALSHFREKFLPFTSKKILFPTFYSKSNFESSGQALQYIRQLLLSVTPVAFHYLLFSPNYIETNSFT